MGAHTKATKRPAADWSLAPAGPVSATAQAALGLAAVAVVGDAVAVDAWWGAAAGAAGALGTAVVSAHQDATPGAIVYRLGAWIGAGSWLTWCLATTPWSTQSLGMLIIGGIGAAVTAPLARSRRPGTGAGTALALRTPATALAAEWQARLARVCRIQGAQVGEPKQWETGAGYSLLVELPVGGATRKGMQQHADGLASDARLPEGCGVEIAPGPHRGSVVLHVSTVDRMRERIPYPVHTYTPKSIMEPVTLGEHRDSSLAQAHWREHAVLITGQKGSGKTTLLHVCTAEGARCADVLVWHIDLTGGGLSRPWLEPWLKGEADRPGVDWAVCTPEDALAMTQAALRIAKNRKGSAFDRKLKANSNLLPIGPDLPEILLVVDEGKTLLSPSARGILGTLRGELEQIQDIARDSAVNPILSGLRATSDTLSTSISTQTTCRIGMAGVDDSELSYLLGWKGLSNDDLAGPGTAYMTDGGPVRPMRVYDLLPQQIGALARQIATWQPTLDDASAAAAGEAYANRYARMRATFTRQLAAGDGAEQADAETAAVPTGRIIAPAGPVRHLRVVPPANAEDGWLTPAERAARTAPAAPAADADAWLTPTERRRAASADADQGDAEQGVVPEILRAALAALDAAADDRMHTGVLAEALGLGEEEVRAQLAAEGVRPLPQPFERGGVRRRGYARDDLVAAAQRHRPGAPVATG